MRKITKFKLLVAFFMFGVVAMAQEGFHKISAGAELALPVGDFSNAFSVGFGATGKAFYGLTSESSITGTLGYIHFPMKSEPGISGHVGMIPLQFGYYHDFGGFYIEPQLGLTFLNSKVEMKGMDDFFGFDFSGTSSETKFGLGLGGGYSFGDWDIGVRYQIIQHANFLGARVAYSFDI